MKDDIVDKGSRSHLRRIIIICYQVFISIHSMKHMFTLGLMHDACATG